MTGPKEFQTDIAKGTFPVFGYEIPHFSFWLNPKNLEIMKKQPLIMEVYQAHLRLNNMHSSLVGIVEIDLSILPIMDNLDTIEGYFHIYEKEKALEDHTMKNYHEMMVESLG